MPSNLNKFDKFIGFFSPKYAFEAEKLRTASSLFGNNLYDGATRTPHYAPDHIGSTVDEDIYDLETLRNTSRDKSKNNGFYKGIIKCAENHVVGSGLKAKSTIKRNLIPGLSEEKAKEYEKVMDNYFNSWAESTICDITAKDNFYAIQALAYRCFKRDGDNFASLPLTSVGTKKVIQIDLIGAENIDSNKIDFTEGIKLSKNRMPIKYSIKQENNTFKEVSAFKGGKRNILHTFERERAKAVRGVPFLSSVMRDVDAIDQYMKYELTAAKLAAIFFGSLTTKSKEPVFGTEDTADLLGGNVAKAQTTQNTVKENAITQLQPDEELKIHQQGRDNPNYDKFIMTSLQKVSTQTRIPLEIILAQFVSSYSASRAAMLLMQKFVSPERQILITSFCKPTRDQVITWGILQGDIVIPEFFENRAAFLNAIWLGDPMGSVDPMKDVNAKIKAVDNCLSTKEQATIDLGNGDYETNLAIRTKEVEMEAPLKEKIRKSEGENNVSN